MPLFIFHKFVKNVFHKSVDMSRYRDIIKLEITRT